MGLNRRGVGRDDWSEESQKQAEQDKFCWTMSTHLCVHFLAFSLTWFLISFTYVQHSCKIQRVAFISLSKFRPAPQSLVICTAKEWPSPATQLQCSALPQRRRSIIVSFGESESERLRGPPVAREESFCSNLVENVSAHRGPLYISKVMGFRCSTWLPSWFIPRNKSLLLCFTAVI